MSSPQPPKGNFIALSVALYLLCNASLYAWEQPPQATDIGYIQQLYSITHHAEQYFKFSLQQETPISIFLDGLSIGYLVQLLDAKGNLLEEINYYGMVMVW